MRAGRITQVGRLVDTEVPENASVIDVSGRFIIPGYVDTHAHVPLLQRILDMSNWALLANLAYGVTTIIDVQPSTVDILAYQDLVDAGRMIGPRLLSTGPGIFNDNRFKSSEHARRVLSRYKDHYRVRNLKSYIAGNREQRQWIVQAAESLGLMPTTEGALDMKLDMTHIIDGFSGRNEHNFPIVDLHTDVVQMAARSGIAYTPTLLVTYGGPAAENYFFTRESPTDDVKLRRFTPPQVIAGTNPGAYPGSPIPSMSFQGSPPRPPRSFAPAAASGSVPTANCRDSATTGNCGRSPAAGSRHTRHCAPRPCMAPR